MLSPFFIGEFTMIAFRCQHLIKPRETKDYVVTMGNTVIPGSFPYIDMSGKNHYNTKILGHYYSIKEYIYDTYQSNIPNNAYDTLIVGNNVTNFYGMFSGCNNFNSRVNLMPADCLKYTFANCNQYNSPLYRVPSLCNNFYKMYSCCYNFNAEVGEMWFSPNNNVCLANMFDRCINFNRPIFVSGANNCYLMFNSCTNLNAPVSLTNIYNGGTLSEAFKNCYALNAPIEISGNCCILTWLLQGCHLFNSSLNLSGITSDAVEVYGAFSGCRNFNQPVVFPNLYTGSSTSRSYNISLGYLFQYCQNFNSPVTFAQSYISNESVGKNISISYSYMFEDCFSLNLPVFNTSSTTNTISIPYCDCITSMEGMFCNCQNYNQITYLPKTTNLCSCYNIFFNCKSLDATIHLPNMVNNLYRAFAGCVNFKNTIYVCGNTFRQINVKYMIAANATIRFNSVLNNQFNRTDSNSIVGASITWTAITNGFYNATKNIYCYYNYAG